MRNSGRQYHLVRFGIFLTVVAFIAGVAGCGSISIEIHDWYDLDTIRDNMRGSYILMNDLDSTTAGYEDLASQTANEGRGWQPIGGIGGDDAFVGSFDGRGHDVYDLFIDRPGESDVGLFGTVEAGATIENAGTVNGNVTGYGNVGGLVGYNRGTVKNSYACADVAGDVNAGGLVGVNGGTVSNSYSDSSVTGRDALGGLVGRNEGTVSNSHSIGNVNGKDLVGDLVGINGGTVSNSYAGGTVHGNDFAGGLVGRNEGAVSKCYSTGNVTGDEHIGGLVGQNLYGVVSNCFWDVQTSGQGSSDGGTGKTTAEMMDIATFSGVGWDIITVPSAATRNTDHIWNIVNGVPYPFLSWQPV